MYTRITEGDTCFAPPDTAPWELLCIAVVRQAADDYESARRILRKRPDDPNAAHLLRDTLSFFRSAWFETLTGLEGEKFLQKLETRTLNKFKEEYRHAVIRQRA